MASLDEMEQKVRDRFFDALLAANRFRGELSLAIRREAIHDVCRFLCDEPSLRFNFLSDLTAVDYLNMGRIPRFDVVYHLLSLEHFHRVRLKVGVAEQDIHIDSMTDIWPAANWNEREVYDMFGIIFEGHPDLTRILMPDDWEGHPLRKDFPVGGSPSFYFKRDSDERAGEPPDLVPRLRTQDSDI
jgi:NADH-quinone oxidoreductase subunit C